MPDLAIAASLPPTSIDALDTVRQVERLAGEREQIAIETQHVLHAGVYTRTICIPAGVMVTGVLIKIPTTLIISGEASVLVGDGDEMLVDGFTVFPAAAGRKQVVLAHTDTYASMSFKTDAKTVAEAEAEFTDEGVLLKSNDNVNVVISTEDQ